MKQTIILLCALAAAGLAGCEQKPPVGEETITAASMSPSAHLVEQMAEVRKAETPFFKGHEAEVARNGDVLTISSSGKPVASFTDNDVYQWILAGSFTTKGRTYFLISQHKMETDTTNINLVVAGDGSPIQWVLDNVLVSDGPILASGLGGSLDMGGPEIDDWTQTPHLKFNFGNPCEPEKWLNATTILAHCPAGEDIGAIESEALITRISATEWQLREKPASYAAVKTAAASASWNARAVFDERVTGVPINPFDSDDLKYLTDSGFQRLP